METEINLLLKMFRNIKEDLMETELILLKKVLKGKKEEINGN